MSRQELITICDNLFASEYQVSTVDTVGSSQVLWAATSDGYSFKVERKRNGEYVVSVVWPYAKEFKSTYTVGVEGKGQMQHAELYAFKSALPVPSVSFSLWGRQSGGSIEELLMFKRGYKGHRGMVAALVCPREFAAVAKLPSELCQKGLVDIRLFWQAVHARKLKRLNLQKPLYIATAPTSPPIACLVTGQTMLASPAHWPRLSKVTLASLRQERKPVSFS